MNKFLLGTLIVLVSGALVAPPIIGSKIKQEIYSGVEKLETNSQYKVTIENLESGWFSTNGTINISFQFAQMFAQTRQNNTSSPLANVSLSMNLKALHGPLLFKKGVGIGLASVTVASDNSSYPDFIEYKSDIPLYTHNGTLFFNGAYQYKDRTQPFSLGNIDSMIETSSSEGVMKSNSFKYDLHFEGGYFAWGDAHIEVGNISVKSISDTGFERFLAGKFTSGEVAGLIEKITVKENQTGGFYNSENIKFEGASRFFDHDTSANITYRYDVEHINMNEFALDDLVVDFQLNKLNLSSINQYLKLSQNVRDLPPEQAAEKLGSSIQSIMIELVQLEPEFNISELSFKVGGGQFESSLFSNISEFDTLPANINDPSFWLKHIGLESQAKMDVAALRNIIGQVLGKNLKASLTDSNLSEEEYQRLLNQQIDSTITALEAGGTFIKEQEIYKYHFLLRDGQAELNGNAMPIPLASPQS